MRLTCNQLNTHMVIFAVITMMDYVEIIVQTVVGAGQLMILIHIIQKMHIVDVKQHFKQNSYNDKIYDIDNFL